MLHWSWLDITNSCRLHDMSRIWWGRVFFLQVLYVTGSKKLKKKNKLKFSLETYLRVVLYFTGSQIPFTVLITFVMFLTHCSIPPSQMSSSIFRLLQGGYCIFCWVTKCRSLWRLWMFLRLLEGILIEGTFHPCLAIFALKCSHRIAIVSRKEENHFSSTHTWVGGEF